MRSRRRSGGSSARLQSVSNAIHSASAADSLRAFHSEAAWRKPSRARTVSPKRYKHHAWPKRHSAPSAGSGFSASAAVKAASAFEYRSAPPPFSAAESMAWPRSQCEEAPGGAAADRSRLPSCDRARSERPSWMKPRNPRTARRSRSSPGRGAPEPPAPSGVGRAPRMSNEHKAALAGANGGAIRSMAACATETASSPWLSRSSAHTCQRSTQSRTGVKTSGLRRAEKAARAFSR